MSEMITAGREESKHEENDPQKIKKYAVENYHHFIVEFLDALCSKYDNTPNGDKFREQKLKYDMAITHNFNKSDKEAKKEELIQSFYDEMQPHFTTINNNDLASIKNIPFCQKLGLAEVIETCDSDTKDAICEYLKNMIQATIMWSVYKNIPDRLLDSIGNAASKMESTNSKNVDIKELSENLMKDINQQDIQNFALNMVQNPAALSDLCNLAASGLKRD